MVLGRARADEQGLADLLVGVAGGDQAQHFGLARGEAMGSWGADVSCAAPAMSAAASARASSTASAAESALPSS